MNEIYWRCFHCGTEFSKAQERWAREHFGADESATPVCKMRSPGESSLLPWIRRMEAEIKSYREEDTLLHRALHEIEADHRQALLREEEKGYARGLRDATKEPRQ
jgi:hypothetical protein